MSYQLTIEPLGASIEVEEGQTLLDAALRQGIYIPHACGHGLCGTCKVDVCDGEVDHGHANPFALMEFERDAGKTLACCATLQSDATIEADIDEEPDAQIIPVQDFDCVVSRIESLTPTIKGIFLKLDRPLHFQAGQYVQVVIPGVQGGRAFSIANSPQRVLASGEIELNVRIVKDGLGTGWLHRELKVGDRLKISGPYGRFFVRKSSTLPMVFMAGGSGLSSPRSMILDLLVRAAARCPSPWCMGSAPARSSTTTTNSVHWRSDTRASAICRRCPMTPPTPHGPAHAGTSTTLPRRISRATLPDEKPICVVRP